MNQSNTVVVADKKFIFDRILESYRFFFRSFFCQIGEVKYMSSMRRGVMKRVNQRALSPSQSETLRIIVSNGQ